jgi:hypothetical protein
MEDMEEDRSKIRLPRHRDPELIMKNHDKWEYDPDSERLWGPKKAHKGAKPHNDPANIAATPGNASAAKESEEQEQFNCWERVSEERRPFTVSDYVIRVEWQKRGMPHAHILLWSSSVQQE